MVGYGQYSQVSVVLNMWSGLLALYLSIYQILFHFLYKWHHDKSVLLIINQIT